MFVLRCQGYKRTDSMLMWRSLQPSLNIKFLKKRRVIEVKNFQKCGFEFLQAVTILRCCLVLEIDTRVHRVVVVVVVVPLWVGGLRDVGRVQRVAHHVARRRIFTGFSSWHLFQERNQFNSNLIQSETLKNEAKKNLQKFDINKLNFSGPKIYFTLNFGNFQN